MKIMNWNIEWMNNWFSGNDNPTWGSNSLSEADARTCAQKVTSIINSVGPDLLCIQEGPSAMAEMDLFMDEFLSSDGSPDYEAIIGSDGGAQKLYVLRRLNGALWTHMAARRSAWWCCIRNRSSFNLADPNGTIQTAAKNLWCKRLKRAAGYPQKAFDCAPIWTSWWPMIQTPALL